MKKLEKIITVLTAGIVLAGGFMLVEPPISCSKRQRSSYNQNHARFNLNYRDKNAGVNRFSLLYKIQNQPN